jgi:hypothetical protein
MGQHEEISSMAAQTVYNKNPELKKVLQVYQTTI